MEYTINRGWLNTPNIRIPLRRGSILLVHTKGEEKSKLVDIIQNVQTKEDAESGIYNHGAILDVTASGSWIVHEATEAPGFKFKGNINMTYLSEYLERWKDGEVDLLFLVPTEMPNGDAMEKVIIAHNGAPYDVGNLAFFILMYYKLGIWLGRKGAKARRRMVCHEWIQTFWNILKGLFPNANRAMVKDVYYEKFFTHYKLS